jgi:hypothetical protein
VADVAARTGLRFWDDASAAPPSLIVVQHWDEDLKRLVPTK